MYSLYIISIEHASLLLVQFRLLLQFLGVSLVAVFQFDLRLAHEVAALVSLLYQLLGALHFRLLIEYAAAQVLFLLAFEAEHILSFPSCFFHFPDCLLLLFLEKLYPIS